MKNKLSFTLAGLVLIFSILSCTIMVPQNWENNGKTVHGSGTVVEESRIVSNISDVELTMQGTLYADTISGGGGNDTLYGNSGGDFIAGGAGSDLLYGEGRVLEAAPGYKTPDQFRLISAAGQDLELSEGSIRENLTLGLEDVDEGGGAAEVETGFLHFAVIREVLDQFCKNVKLILGEHTRK